MTRIKVHENTDNAAFLDLFTDLPSSVLGCFSSFFFLFCTENVYPLTRHRPSCSGQPQVLFGLLVNHCFTALTDHCILYKQLSGGCFGGCLILAVVFLSENGQKFEQLRGQAHQLWGTCQVGGCQNYLPVLGTLASSSYVLVSNC